MLHTDAMTCAGKTWGEILADIPKIENEMTRPLEKPWHPWGSLGILKGNLAPLGGGPGMREMARIMKMLYGRNLALSTAIVTDERFSGTNNGCLVGHISPEASEGGPIAAVQDGDTILVDNLLRQQKSIEAIKHGG